MSDPKNPFAGLDVDAVKAQKRAEGVGYKIRRILDSLKVGESKQISDGSINFATVRCTVHRHSGSRVFVTRRHEGAMWVMRLE